MQKIIATSLSVLTVTALLGLSNACAAHEIYLVRDGKPLEKNMVQRDLDPASGWTERKGTTVEGFFCPEVSDRNSWYWPANKSALGDCEFTVTFQAHANECRPRAYSGPRGPRILIVDRGDFGFYGRGNHILLSSKRIALPLKEFHEELTTSAHDGKTHTLAVKRVGDAISFWMDGRKLNEQKIEPEVNLIFALNPIESRPRIASMKLTAERFSDNLKTAFKTVAPIQEIFVGEGSSTFKKPVYGRAASYRIPALAVSKKGTILAFCEARRINKNDCGDIDAVVKRSEDGGKTWGPEILIIDYGTKSVNNHSPVVDPETGRIWVIGNVSDIDPRPVLVSYSDDDGKTWSKAKDIQKELLTPNPNAVIYGAGPGAGIVLERGEHAGRFVIPMNFGYAGMCVSGAIYSDDRGKTWKTGGMLRVTQLMTEARCVELLDGSLLFNARTIEGKRAHCILPEGGSKDTKKRWLQADLIDPNCQGAIFRYSWPKGDKPGLILYSGPAAPKARAQGTLFGSYDDGKTWPWKQTYYEGGSGYSDGCLLPDGRVAVLFEKDGKIKLGFTIAPKPPAEPPKGK